MKAIRSFIACLPFLALSIWSYALVDGNLTLFRFPWFLQFQTTLWRFAQDSWLVALSYFVLVVATGFSYAFFLHQGKKQDWRWMGFVLAVLAVFLLFGHNALSRDIYNYLFNAKMVVQWGANPHVQTALDFASDPWVRFMHNIHTPAPYGWGWTLWSLPPIFLSFGKFLPAYFLMRLWMVLGWAFWLAGSWALTQRFFPKQVVVRWTLLAFLPLPLIETLLIGHNDVWMMGLALWALVLATQSGSLWQRGVSLFFGGVLLALSIWMKFVTVLLVPLFLFFALESVWKKLPLPVFFRFAHSHWAGLTALVLLLPLLTSRSQQFHPWYLIWALSFLPLISWRWLRYILIALSFSSLLRYLPWLQNALMYSESVLWMQKSITASGLVAGIVFWLTSLRRTK